MINVTLQTSENATMTAALFTVFNDAPHEATVHDSALVGDIIDLLPFDVALNASMGDIEQAALPAWIVYDDRLDWQPIADDSTANTYQPVMLED